MAIEVGPFDGQFKYQQFWSDFFSRVITNGRVLGYLNNLKVRTDVDGMQVKVEPGAAFVRGHVLLNDADETLTIDDNSSGNPRIDRVIVREGVAALGNMELDVIKGNPAASPTPPPLTQTALSWEEPLAQVRVENGATTIDTSKVTLEHYYAGSTGSEWLSYTPTWTPQSGTTAPLTSWNKTWYRVSGGTCWIWLAGTFTPAATLGSHVAISLPIPAQSPEGAFKAIVNDRPTSAYQNTSTTGFILRGAPRWPSGTETRVFEAGVQWFYVWGDYRIR